MARARATSTRSRGDRDLRRGALRAADRAAIVAARASSRSTRTAQLAELVARAVRTREPGKHPATRTFQAIRIHINDELASSKAALDAALECSRAAGGWR